MQNVSASFGIIHFNIEQYYAHESSMHVCCMLAALTAGNVHVSKPSRAILVLHAVVFVCWWLVHYSFMSPSDFCQIRDFLRIRKHLNLSTYKLLAPALVCSRLDYCNLLFNTTFAAFNLNGFQTVKTHFKLQSGYSDFTFFTYHKPYEISILASC